MDSQKPKIQKTAFGTFEQFLVDHGFLSKAQHDKLLTIKSAKYGSAGSELEQRELSQLLVAEKILDDEDVAKAKAAFLNLPYIELGKLQIPDEVLNLVPEESRTFYKMIPFEQTGHDLKIALTDPTNIQALEALEFLGQKNNYAVHIYVASTSSIVSFIEGGRRNIDSVVGEALLDIEKKR
jgi:hypothetical protein